MARNLNIVTVEGNIVATPELRFTGNGTAVTNITVAVNHSRKVGDGWEDEANFVDVTLFGALAEQTVETVDKGDRIIVNGRLAQRNWETPEGDKRSKLEIVAEVVAPSLRYATAAITRIKRDEG